jgi:competence protein ComEC
LKNFSVRNALVEHPMALLAVLIWVMLGVVLLSPLGNSQASGIAQVSSVVLCAVVIAGLAWRYTSRSVAGLLLLGLLATYGSYALQQGIGRAAIEQLGDKAYFSSAEVELQLLDSPIETSSGFRAHARLLRVEGQPLRCLKQPAKVIPLLSPLSGLACEPRGAIRFASDSAKALPVAGQVICANAFMKPGQQRDQFEAKLSEISIRALTGPNVWLADLHRGYRSSVSGVTPDARALVMGLAVGDTSKLPAELKQAMQTTGLTHLNAVSGANCAIVIGLVWFLVSRTRLNRTGRLLFSLGALGVYVLIVGQQPSVLRAAVMLVAVMLGRFVGRGIQATDALSTAIVILLICDPWLAFDYGFLLSVLATLGLVLLSEPIAKRLQTMRLAGKQLPNGAAQALGVVLAAQVLCLPVIIALSGFVPAYTVMANLLAEPLVAPVTVIGLLSVAFTGLPPVTIAMSWLASLPAQVIAIVAKSFAAMPGSQLPWPGGALGIVIALAVSISATWLLLSTKLRRWAWVALAVSSAAGLSLSLVKPIQAIGWPNPNWTIVACDVGQGDSFVLKSRGQVAVVDVGRDPQPVSDCLKRIGVSSIDLLVLTHFDMDHVGGLAGVLKTHRVLTILETPWPDARPTADFIRAEAQASGAAIVLAQTGMTGAIGDFRWRVLTPSRTAVEAEDSNDGSIGMIWSSSRLNFLTLADLGEKAQMRIVEQDAGLVAEAKSKPLVLKVAHHGSADFYPELYEALRAPVALIGVGRENSYGHPTQRALESLRLAGSRVFRTDLEGDIGVSIGSAGQLTVAVAGGG